MYVVIKMYTNATQLNVLTQNKQLQGNNKNAKVLYLEPPEIL